MKKRVILKPGEVKIDAETGEEIIALRPMGRTATGVRGIKLDAGPKSGVVNCT